MKALKAAEAARLVTPGAPGAPRETGPRGKPYVPPKVTRLGNMVDVTLKSGTPADSSTTWPSKT